MWLPDVVLVVLVWSVATTIGEDAPVIAEWADRRPRWLQALLWLPLLVIVFPMRFIRNFWTVVEVSHKR
jgi:hypothetical protein